MSDNLICWKRGKAEGKYWLTLCKRSCERTNLQSQAKIIQTVYTSRNFTLLIRLRSILKGNTSDWKWKLEIVAQNSLICTAAAQHRRHEIMKMIREHFCEVKSCSVNTGLTVMNMYEHVWTHERLTPVIISMCQLMANYGSNSSIVQRPAGGEEKDRNITQIWMCFPAAHMWLKGLKLTPVQ